MSYTLQPDHYPGLKLSVICESGEVVLQSFEPYSKSRPHLVEVTVNGEFTLMPLSSIQRCLSTCKGVDIGDKRASEIGYINGSSLYMENLLRTSSKDKKLVKIKIQKKSAVTVISDFQKALTQLKQCREEKLKAL